MDIDFINFFCIFGICLITFFLWLCLVNLVYRLLIRFIKSRGKKVFEKVLSCYQDDFIEFKNNEDKSLLIFESLNNFEVYCLLNHLGVKKRDVYNNLLVQLFGCL